MPKKTVFFYATVYWNEPGKKPVVWRFDSKRKRSSALKKIKDANPDGIYHISEEEKLV